MNLENYKKAIVQITTSEGTSSGFCLKNKNIIITNNHILNGASEVVISGINIEKQFTKVLFSDSIYNLAFLQIPDKINLPNLILSKRKKYTKNEKVTAIGYSNSLNFTAISGVISNIEKKWNRINFFQIDSAINKDNSGGPLIDKNNKIIGINTNIQNKNIKLAIPVKYLKTAIEEYKNFFGKFAVKCHSCFSILTSDSIDNDFCPNCGAKINQDESNKKEYILSSAGKKIEEIIKQLEYNVKLSRIGDNLWEIKENSALIHIKYNNTTKYFVAYSKLFKLKNDNLKQTYEYLLKENNKLKELSFSINKQDIILSSMFVYEDNIHIDTGVELLKYLIEKTEYYYNNI